MTDKEFLQELFKQLEAFVKNGKQFRESYYYSVQKIFKAGCSSYTIYRPQVERLITLWNRYDPRNASGNMCSSKMAIKYRAVTATLSLIQDEMKD